MNLHQRAKPRIRNWKLLLERIIIHRFESAGHFNCPLVEVWVDLLGQNHSDTKDEAKWRHVLESIKCCLDEWEGIGLISNVTLEAKVLSPQMPPIEWISCKPGSAVASPRGARD